MKIRNKLWIAMLAGAALLAACDDKKAEGGGDKAGGSDDMPKVCADYVSKMEACLKKVPDAAKPGMEQGLKAMKDSFKSAKSADQKKALEPGCKAALDAIAKNPACK